MSRFDLGAHCNLLVSHVVPEYARLGTLAWAHAQGSLVLGYTDESDLDVILVWDAPDVPTGRDPVAAGLDELTDDALGGLGECPRGAAGGAPMSALRSHDITLAGERVVLRPMTERDWPLIESINNNPEVGYFSEADEWTPYPLEKLQRTYRSISQNALMFVIEHRGEPVGECWLQRMNAQRILDEFPGRDVRRIDIAIGAPRLWGKGLGSEAIRLLVRLAFEREGVDLLVCFCSGHNPRSRRAFENAGLSVRRTVPRPGSPKADFSYDLIVTREQYERTRELHRPPPTGDPGSCAPGCRSCA